MKLINATPGQNVTRGEGPSLQDFKKVLDAIAGDSRVPQNFAEWICDTLRYGGRKIRILQYILAHTSKNQTPLLLDVGAQFGAFAIYASQLGCRAVAVDYGMYARVFREAVADCGVDYHECDLGCQPLPFADNSFDFVTYTDVIEHHAFSPKRVLAEIHRVLVPGGLLILATPNHASIYNRIKLFGGGSVNDEFDYFFNTTADARTYDGHHREFTRAEIRSALDQTDFRVLECYVIDDDLDSLLNYWRRVGGAKTVSDLCDFVLRFLGTIWSTLRMPFGRWIWAVGEKIPTFRGGDCARVNGIWQQKEKVQSKDSPPPA